MEFTIEFYETRSGRCPVSDFLDELKKSDPDNFAAVLAGLARLRNREYRKPPLSKPVGDELFELRHVGKLNTRVLYFFMKGRRIILLHGIRKKARALSARDHRIALERKRDWLERNPG
jgi:phage-related protein